MSIENNLKLLVIERQMWVDREKKALEDLKPFQGDGWIYVSRRLDEAEMKLTHAKRASHGLNYRNTSKE